MKKLSQQKFNPDWLMNDYVNAKLSGAVPRSYSVGSTPQAHRIAASAEENKIFKDGERQMLWGGPKEYQHFDITEFRLETAKLMYGLGREAFAALMAPEFDTASEADAWLDNESEVLAVKIGDEVKVYPVALLRRHEVVNDIVGGRSVFACFCHLANLGAVYDRQMGEHTFTFALSGYTCRKEGVWEGRHAFVLWDRDTESLWWPPGGKAISGPMIDASLKVLEEELWAQTRWYLVRDAHPQALVLRPGQTMREPKRFPRLAEERIAALRGEIDVASAQGTDPSADEVMAEDERGKDIPPRWGSNYDLSG